MLKEHVSARLFEHSWCVAAACVELAARWRAPIVEAEIAGWLHDYCKELDAREMVARVERAGLVIDPVERRRPVQLLHARLAGAELATLGVPLVSCRAIARHTVGGVGMNVLERCLYVADAAEPGRSYDGVDVLRRLCLTSLDEAVAWSARRTLARLVERGRPIHPDTVALYNEICV